ncbi:MAG: toll/interleukin-1 receptor domain-containing protein [Chloroflexota bacterium]|nr:toll/interleukin-1 receptor domain-containing protein [Chloroflexota bacterium]
MPPELATDYEYDVFISYSHHDKVWVRSELLPRLETAGLSVCIDFRDFRPGAPSITEMERAATTSRKTVLVLTPEYLASDWSTFENIMLQTLDPVNRTLRVIPILKMKVDLPPRIGSITYINFADPNDIDFAWTRLLKALGGPIEDPRPLRIFLGYEHEDQQSVRRLYNRMRNDGFEPWMQEIDVLPGQDAESEVHRAVLGADVIVVCLSGASINKDGNLRGDTQLVLDIADQQPRRGIYVVPVKLEECTTPERLQRLRAVKLFEPDGYEQLVLSLRHVAARERNKQESHFLTPPNFSWGGGIETPWFVLTDENLLVQASSGDSKTYQYAELVGVTPIENTTEFELVHYQASS